MWDQIDSTVDKGLVLHTVDTGSQSPNIICSPTVLQLGL